MDVCGGRLSRGEVTVETSSFQRAIRQGLADSGFSKKRGLVLFDAGFSSILVGFEIGFDSREFASVGYWINALGPLVARVELCHLYIRMDRLFPSHSQLILDAGDRRNPFHEECCERLASEFRETLSSEMKASASFDVLRAKVSSDNFAGLVRREAREYFASA